MIMMLKFKISIRMMNKDLRDFECGMVVNTIWAGLSFSETVFEMIEIQQ